MLLFGQLLFAHSGDVEGWARQQLQLTPPLMALTMFFVQLRMFAYVSLSFASDIP